MGGFCGTAAVSESPPPCSTAMVAIESGELFLSESKSMTAYLKIESAVMPQCEQLPSQEIVTWPCC